MKRQDTSLWKAKQLAECRGRIIGKILHREEREEHKQLQHLKTGELTDRILYSYFVTYVKEFQSNLCMILKTFLLYFSQGKLLS